MTIQASNKEGSKKQEMEAVSLLRFGPKTHKFTSAMSTGLLRCKGRGQQPNLLMAAGLKDLRPFLPHHIH